MWDQEKVTVVPIIIGATGEVPHTLLESIKKLNLKENIYHQLQKIVLIETSGIVRRVLNDPDNQI